MQEEQAPWRSRELQFGDKGRQEEPTGKSPEEHSIAAWVGGMHFLLGSSLEWVMLRQVRHSPPSALKVLQL